MSERFAQKIIITSAIFLACSFGGRSLMHAAVTPKDDTNLDGSTYYVGINSFGQLQIDYGSVLTSSGAYIGYNVGSSGTVTVTGADSAWANSVGLFIGNSGSGSLTIENGGQVSTSYSFISYSSGSIGSVSVLGAKSSWASSWIIVGNSDSGQLTIRDGGQVNSSSSYLGYGAGSTGTVMVSGTGSTWTNLAGLIVGGSGSGSLTIENGGKVDNNYSYIGQGSGSTGIVTVTGAGSTWTNSGELYIGNYGNGNLMVTNGGQIRSSSSYGTSVIGYDSNSIGTAMVMGKGSIWVSGESIYIGNGSFGKGALTIADGGQVTAKNISINSRSTLHMHVSNSGMLVLGDASTNGSLINNGTVKLYADAHLATGVYTPIIGLTGKSITWSGSGTYNAIGGIWDSNTKTFIVRDVKTLSAGESHTLVSGERLVITDAVSGQSVGASFGDISGNTSFSASLINGDDLNSLLLQAAMDDTVLASWNFTTTLIGGEALLSFDIGDGVEHLQLWHFSNNMWAAYTPDLLTYDSNGFVNFTVSSFSSYAVTGISTVPEPATLTSALVGLTGMLIRRRSKLPLFI